MRCRGDKLSVMAREVALRRESDSCSWNRKYWERARARDKLPSEKFANIGSGGACVRCRGAARRDLEYRKTKCWSLVPLRRRINKYFTLQVYVYMCQWCSLELECSSCMQTLTFGSVERKEIHLEIIRCASACQIASPRALCCWETSSTARHFFSRPISLSIEKVQTVLKYHIPRMGEQIHAIVVKSQVPVRFTSVFCCFPFPFGTMIAVKNTNIS